MESSGTPINIKKRSGDIDSTDDEITFALQTKRTALESSDGQNYSNPEPPLLFKVLCPSASIGFIIGKAGSVINELNEKTGAKIRISQADEIYPETTDRIICMSGNITVLIAAIEQVVARILEVVDRKQHPSNDTPVHLEFRCLIPAAASGALIGRGGVIIKQMGESSQCRLKVGEQRGDPYDTKERILTVTGSTIPNIVSAVLLVHERMIADPATSVYINVKTAYSNYRRGPPHGRMDYPPGGSGPDRGGGGYENPQFQQGRGDSRQLQGGMPNRNNFQQQQQGGYPQQYQQGQQQQQQMQGGFGMGMGMGMGGGPQQRMRYDPMPGSFVNSGNSNPYVSSPMPATSNLFPQGVSVPSFSTDGVNIIMEIGIDDLLLGNIIGKQGAIIKEIMAVSGTRIQVSQKNEFLPNSTFRPVKVAGSQEEVQSALSNIVGRIQMAVDRPRRP